MILLIAFGVVLAFLNLISFWMIIGVAVGYLIFLLVISTNVRLNFFVRAHNANPIVGDRSIAITFDDGPVENTKEILSILKKYDVKASFFCIGQHIENNPEIFELLLEDGHFIGNHSYCHTKKMGFLSSKDIVKEIKACDAIIYKIAGINSRTFRPPFGVINPNTQKALVETGHVVVGWNVRSYDAVLSSSNFVLRRILRKIKPGDVILLHDNNLKTVHILEQLLIFLKDNNYTPVRVDTLFNIDAYN